MFQLTKVILAVNQSLLLEDASCQSVVILCQFAMIMDFILFDASLTLELLD